MLIFYQNVSSSRDISSIRPDGADIVILNYHNELYFNVTVGIPIALKEARRSTIQYDCAMLMHAKMNIEGERYLSTIFIDRGEITGVADCISKCGFLKGKALHVYNIGSEPIGIAVDEDVKYSLTDNLFAEGASTIFHNTLSDFDKEYYKAYGCHRFLRGGRYFALFADCALLSDKDIKILPDRGYAEIESLKPNNDVMKRMRNVTSE